MVPMSINIKSIILPKHPHLVSYPAPAPKEQSYNNKRHLDWRSKYDTAGDNYN